LEQWISQPPHSNNSFSGLCDMATSEWVNKNHESGLPYDIKITMNDGSEKYCEVKTRVVRDVDVEGAGAVAVANSWFISPQEVAFAVEKQESYFVCGVCIAIDVNAVVVSTQATPIGIQTGLVDAVRCSEAQLLIRSRK